MFPGVPQCQPAQLLAPLPSRREQQATSSKFDSASDSDTTLGPRLYKKVVGISQHTMTGGWEEPWVEERN